MCYELSSLHVLQFWDKSFPKKEAETKIKESNFDSTLYNSKRKKIIGTYKFQVVWKSQDEMLNCDSIEGVSSYNYCCLTQHIEDEYNKLINTLKRNDVKFWFESIPSASVRQPFQGSPGFHAPRMPMKLQLETIFY